MGMLRCLLLLALGLLATMAPARQQDEDRSDEKAKPEEDQFVWKAPEKKVFSKKQIDDECRKYQGKYVGYYGRLFWVHRCQLHELVGEDLSNRLLRKSDVKVVSIDGDTVAMIPEGDKLDHLPDQSKVSRTCDQLEGQYVIYGASDIFYIHRCKRLQLPDHETFREHAKKHGKPELITELSSEEFYRIKTGEPIQSIMPAVAKKLMDYWGDVDIVDVDTACEGLEGKYVSYFEHIYLIDRCRKRQVQDLSKFFGQTTAKLRSNLIEMSSEQWVSLPDGPPVD